MTKYPIYTYDWNTGIYTCKWLHDLDYDHKIYNYVSNSTRFDQQYFLNWDKKFENHNISAMAVYELLSDNNYWFRSLPDYVMILILTTFLQDPILTKLITGSASEGGRNGIISRLNYDYKGKYLVELNSP